MSKRTHEEHVSQLELQAAESKAEYEKRIEELERHLADARKQVKELEAFSESKSLKWKNREHTYQRFINHQFGAFQVCFFVLLYAFWLLISILCSTLYNLMLYRN